MTATHCLRGHDIAAVGRSRKGMCRECLRAWDRARNTRRRQDPAYRTRQRIWAAHWYQSLTPEQSVRRNTKAWLRALRAGMDRKEDQLATLREYALALGIPPELIR